MTDLGLCAYSSVNETQLNIQLTYIAVQCCLPL